jgi:hypothetical protein
MQRVKPGQPILARTFNRLTDALRPASNPVNGSGVLKTTNPGNITFGLSRIPHAYAVPAVVKEVVYADGSPVPEPYVQNVTYTAVAIGAPSAIVTGRAPKYGRVYASGVRIEPAQVGDLCYIVRLPRQEGGYTDDLEVLSEKIIARACVPPAASRGGVVVIDPITGLPIIVEPPTGPPVIGGSVGNPSAGIPSGPIDPGGET